MNFLWVLVSFGQSLPNPNDSYILSLGFDILLKECMVHMACEP